MRAFAGVDVHPDNVAYRRPLESSARALACEMGEDCEVVLLGSIASPKYATVVLDIFGERLRFRVEFVGRGDMSRGGLPLRTAGRRRSCRRSHEGRAWMDVADFDFKLPPELIAQEPPSERGASRLLQLERGSGAITHTQMSALPGLLRAGDLLVVNDTRVFPARLLGRRVPSGGAVECLLIARVAGSGRGLTPESNEQRWEALMHPGQKLRAGSRIMFEGSPFAAAGSALHGEVLERGFFGRRVIRLWTEDGSSVEAAVDAVGHVPLPPYIKRGDRPVDRERYQTVFAAERGSVAAPTAGLHFSEPLLADLRARGVDTVGITLHVGYGTFQPVRVERVADHRLEPERYEVGQAAADTINRALDERRRVVAVGTTTTRTLEAVAKANDGRLVAGAGATDLFIFPWFPFRVIQGLITNFHVPRSSLLMLVSAFAGRERVLRAYVEAVEKEYRFYSYGDAMLIL